MNFDKIAIAYTDIITSEKCFKNSRLRKINASSFSEVFFFYEEKNPIKLK